MGVCLLGLSPPRSVTVYIIYVHWGLWGQILPTLLSWRFPGDLVEHCFGVSVKVFQENSLWVTDSITKICPQHRQTKHWIGPRKKKSRGCTRMSVSYLWTVEGWAPDIGTLLLGVYTSWVLKMLASDRVAEPASLRLALSQTPGSSSSLINPSCFCP